MIHRAGCDSRQARHLDGMIALVRHADERIERAQCGDDLRTRGQQRDDAQNAQRARS